MKKYVLELVYIGNNSISTIITDINNGCSREEIWIKNEDDKWGWENGWTSTGMFNGLYQILNGNDERTDEMLNEVAKIGTITFSI